MGQRPSRNQGRSGDGRGGIGKSKLLWEVASRADVHVRFLAVGQQPVAADFEHLPRTGSLVVVLDDAHDAEHVAGIVAQLWQSRPEARALMATRPYGKAELDAEIWRLDRDGECQALGAQATDSR